jgi:hypothetical protein
MVTCRRDVDWRSLILLDNENNFELMSPSEAVGDESSICDDEYWIFGYGSIIWKCSLSFLILDLLRITTAASRGSSHPISGDSGSRRVTIEGLPKRLAAL